MVAIDNIVRLQAHSLLRRQLSLELPVGGTIDAAKDLTTCRYRIQARGLRWVDRYADDPGIKQTCIHSMPARPGVCTFKDSVATAGIEDLGIRKVTHQRGNGFFCG
jgi:hypothetical protein